MSKRKYIVAGVLAAGIAMSGTAYAATTTPQGSAPAWTQGIGVRGARGAIEAQLLGITQDEFEARIKAGENPKDMLAAAGITKEDMHAAMEAQMKERLAQAVSSGKITQTEADARIAKMQARDQKHQAVETALQNKDYAAWSAAVAGTPIASQVTEQNFAQFAEAHELMEQGKRDEAKQILDSLGITPQQHGFGHRGGMHRGFGPGMNATSTQQ